MNVFVTTAYDTPWSCSREILKAAAIDRFGEHRPVDTAESADLILFTDARADLGDWGFRKLRSHPLVTAFPERCFVYCIMDEPWCGMPGLYTSMPAWAFERSRQRACAYVATPNSLLMESTPSRESTADECEAPSLLFSFYGRNCHPVRARLLRLTHPRGEVRDTSSADFFGGANSPGRDVQADYVAAIRRSKFVLCPRGSGTSSFRLFETLALGRVPVIVSDQWMPVEGPNWDSCALRVRQSDVEAIPTLVERAEPKWPVMAAAARAAWLAHFAPDVVWHRMIEMCVDISRSNPRRREQVARRLPSVRSLQLFLRAAKASLIRRVVRSARGT